MTSARTGADAICDALKEAGVETVFGVPGTQTVPLYEALRRAGLQTVTATHELAATFMAQAYFRASGRLAAVSAIPGPGFAFALAALPEAYLDSAAVVVLTGQPPRCEYGRRRAQAVDQVSMARPVVKEAIYISDGPQAADLVRKACAIALAEEPGPVLVEVAPNAYADQVGADDGVSGDLARADVCDADALARAVEFVSAARRVMLFAGQGAAHCGREVGRLVGELGAVIATTPSGRGLLPEDDDRVLLLDATGDLSAFNAVAAECDAIVVLGAALGENGSVGFGLDFPVERLVRVDVSSAVLAAPPTARFSVKASCARFLIAMLDALARQGRPAAERGFDAAAARAMRARLRDRRTGGPSDARVGGADARTFFVALRRGLPTDGCLVLDSGMHQLLARRHFLVLRPRGLLFPSDFQSMAYGLPGAIGAKLAQPERAVAAVIGDGGFSMTGFELRTAVRLGLSLPIVVLDDEALGLIRLDQLLSFGHVHATDLGAVNYEAVARAFDCHYASAAADTIEQQIRAALGRSGPTLIVVQVADAPALGRVRRRRILNQTVKAMLGARIMRVLRRLRAGLGG